MQKKLKSVLIMILVICLVPSYAFAHPGYTDINGGHHDYNNISNLGSYHYHCGGYAAHLHPNGICPHATNGDLVGTAMSASALKKATITSCNVKINGNTVNNSKLKYPIISYNNITYFPLTYRNKLSLGLTHEAKYNNIYITSGSAGTYIADIEGASTVGKTITATTLNCVLYVNEKVYFYDTSWPLLKYNDIIYIPMTFDFANTLNLDISWSQEDGLSISSRGKQVAKPAELAPQGQSQNGVKQQTATITEPVIYFQPINTSERPILNMNSTYYVFSLEENSKYLGKVSSDLYSEDSIFNMSGTYGGMNSETSIWSTSTRYGSIYSDYSAMSTIASYPPVIVDINGKAYGLLTLNNNLDSPALPTYTPSELRTIFTPQNIAITQSPVSAPTAVPATSASSKLNKYEEYYIYSDDGKNKYLGKITSNQFDSESIWNEFGRYGNDLDIDTIWCEVGTYGNSISRYSSSSTLATHPPKIYDKNGNFVAYLTENIAKYPSYTKIELTIMYTK